MSKYTGLYTFDVDNHRFIPVGQADGIIDCFNFKRESQEPLIRDPKARKAIRAWAEANEIEEVAVMCHLVWQENMTEIAKTDNACLRIVFPDDLGIKMGAYTIAELCGDEEE